MATWPQTPKDSTDANGNAWFDELEVPSPTPPKKSRKPLVILLGIIVFLPLITVAVILMVSANQRTACLTSDDYKTLTGTTLTESISPTTNFYANAIAFQRGSISYDTTSDANVQGEQLLQKIAQLYKSQRTTSIQITVSSDYFAKDAAELAQKRIAAVQTSLINMGIASSDIQIIAPSYSELEEADSAPQDNVTTTLSIVSYQTCVEEALDG